MWDRSVFLGVTHAPILRVGPSVPQNILGPYQGPKYGMAAQAAWERVSRSTLMLRPYPKVAGPQRIPNFWDP